MPKYLLAFHGGGMPETPEEQAAVMAAWGAWYGTLGDAVVDPGAPDRRQLDHRTLRRGDPGGGACPVSGYTLISAESLDDAVAKAQGCPIKDSGGSIEVGETIDMGDVTLRPRPRLTSYPCGLGAGDAGRRIGRLSCGPYGAVSGAPVSGTIVIARSTTAPNWL